MVQVISLNTDKKTAHKAHMDIAVANNSALSTNTALLINGFAAGCSALAFMGGGMAARAQPVLSSVEAGNVSINQSQPDVTNIVQGSHRAVVNWDNFDIHAGETVNVVQPGQNSILLNRVLDATAPTRIDGALNANGHVWIMDAAGVMFGSGARVDVGGLMATTANIDTDQFMAGHYDFDQAGQANAEIINEGVITAADGGSVALLGAKVRNDGTITANLGKVVLAGAETFTVDFAGDGLINVALNPVAGDSLTDELSAENTGAIHAHAGQVNMTVAEGNAAVERMIEMTGAISVDSVGVNDAGQIVLGAEDTLTTISGSLSAQGLQENDLGGDIAITAGHIMMEKPALVDVSGSGGAGSVSIEAESMMAIGTIQATSDEGMGGFVDIAVDGEIQAVSSHKIDVSGYAGGGILYQLADKLFGTPNYKANSEAGAGGEIYLGGNIGLLSSNIEANGATEGGVIHVGGNWQGGIALDEADRLQTAENTFVSAGSHFSAQGMGTDADGGEVVIWADNTTNFHGSIHAQGAGSGAGGQIEVSGKQTLSLGENLDIQTGGGSLLLDPQHLIIGTPTGVDAVKLAFFNTGDNPLNSSDRFGSSMALNSTGNLLAVGARGQDSSGFDAGSVYLFSLDETDLSAGVSFEYRITEDDIGVNALDDFDNFGVSVALNGTGDILAVGADGDDDGGANAGAVYLFNFDETNIPTSMSFEYKITESDIGANTLDNDDFFGNSVALNGTGDILAVGAIGDDDAGADAGAVYLFSLDETNLAAGATFENKNTQSDVGYHFGSSLALNNIGDILAIGADRDSGSGTDDGAVYLFSLDETNLAAGASFEYKITESDIGANTLDNDDFFGSSVALNDVGDILAIGALGDDDGGTDAGAVYLFNLDETNLAAGASFEYKITESDIGANTLDNEDFFGSSVALNGVGDILAIGAIGDDDAGNLTGAAYMFDLNPINLSAGPTLAYKTQAGDADAFVLTSGDQFGTSIALNYTGNVLAVGTPGDNGNGWDGGAAYLFSMDINTLNASFEYKITEADIGVGALDGTDMFGESLTLNETGDVLAIGSLQDDDSGPDSGAVYLFSLDETNLAAGATFEYKITETDIGVDALSDGDRFGVSVSLNGIGNNLAVGTRGDDDSGTNAGAVYLFSLDETNLAAGATFEYKITETDIGGNALDNNDRFGQAVAFNSIGNNLAIGARGDDDGAADAGAVYLFSVDETNLAAGATFEYKITETDIGVNALDNNDRFGRSVAFNAIGDTMAIGAIGDDDSAADAGAVYLFSLDETNLAAGVTFEYKITETDIGVDALSDGDRFGVAVSINGVGDILAIGAQFDSSVEGAAGASYFFSLDETNLSEGPFNSSIRSYVAPSFIEAQLAAGTDLSLTADESITVLEAINVGGANTATLTLETLNPNAVIDINNTINLNGGTLDINAGLANTDVTFNSTFTNTLLEVVAGGDIVFQNAVNITDGLIQGTNITFNDTATLAGTTSLTGDTVFTNDTLLAGTANLTGPVTLNNAAADFTLQGNNNIAGALNLTLDRFSIGNNAQFTMNSLALTANEFSMGTNAQLVTPLLSNLTLNTPLYSVTASSTLDIAGDIRNIALEDSPNIFFDGNGVERFELAGGVDHYILGTVNNFRGLALTPIIVPPSAEPELSLNDIMDIIIETDEVFETGIASGSDDNLFDFAEDISNLQDDIGNVDYFENDTSLTLNDAEEDILTEFSSNEIDETIEIETNTSLLEGDPTMLIQQDSNVNIGPDATIRLGGTEAQTDLARQEKVNNASGKVMINGRLVTAKNGRSNDNVCMTGALGLGNTVLTGRDGTCFTTKNGSEIRLAQKSKLNVQKVFYSPDGKESDYINLERGVAGFFTDRNKHIGEVKTILPGVAIKIIGAEQASN